MKYRSEIDGLRAVAVLPVILFHAGFDVFRGGFVGVDIFFVISGYLITTILLSEIERGEFSIARFYERRARRILPALFLVMAVCIPFAWMWMIPDQLRDFGRSLVAVVFFVSNFLFWREEGGYFAAAAELKPLLHTWSLAVEEQYYLFAPLVLALLWRFGRRAMFWTVVATALASLLLTEWGWRYAPTANFYLTPFRVWELLAGSICGFLITGPRPPRASNLLSGVGLGLIVFSIFFFSRYTPFPSFYALAPVGGAALIVLYAGRETYVARLLSIRLLVGVGLISYSAYLWHQPLFAFARIRSMVEPSPTLLLGLSVLSLVLAYLSWRFVEQPFRKGPHSILSTRNGVFAASAGVGVLFVAFGTYASMTHGAPARLASLEPDSRAARLLETVKTHPLGLKCGRDAAVLTTDPKLCPIFEPADPKQRILVIGDSHAYAILPAFAGVGRENAVYHLGLGSCPPIAGVSILRGVLDIGVCENLARRQLQAVREGNFDIVVLVARWSLYPGGNSAGTSRFFVLGQEGDPSFPSIARSREIFETQLQETVRQYLDLGVAVVLVQQMPEQLVLPQKILEQAVLLGFGSQIGEGEFEEAIWESAVTVADDQERQLYAATVLDQLKGEKVWVLSFSQAFEKDGRYVWGNRDGSYYMDGDHISASGARFLEPEMTAAFGRIEEALGSR